MSKTKNIATIAILANDVLKLGTHFISDELRRQSKKRDEVVELPNVIELKLNNAIDQLKKKGFEVEAIVINTPKKSYANLEVNTVVKMKPTPSMAHKKFLPKTLIKLYYVNDNIISEAKILKDAHESKKHKKIKK